MGSKYLHLSKIFLLIIPFAEICAAQNDITLSVFTVTSKSITVRWSGHAGASSYKITATPKKSPEPSVFAQFSGSTVMGSVNSLSPNTVYRMRVEAMDNAVNVLSSAETEEITAPEVPSIHQAYSKHSDSITVEFGQVSGATGYILRAENEDGFFSESVVESSPGTVVNLQPYTQYTLSVMSVNSGGRSQPSFPVSAKTVVVAPELSSISPSSDTIVVTWNPVDNAVLYTLCVIMEGSDTRVKLNTSQTNITFDALEPGTTYCIKGNAWDSDGNQGDDITIYQITRPPVPGDVQVQLTPGRSIGLEVYWQLVHGADSYFAVSSAGENCSSSDAFCIISPLNCSQNHTITVTASNQAGPSDPSAPEDLLTFPCPPELVWVKEPSAGNCSVIWSEVLWVDYYIAYVKRDDGLEEHCNTTGTTCIYECNCGYTYLTTVFAYNQVGSSPPGVIVNYTTIPCCPEDVSVSLISTETLEILWSAVRGAELYETIAADGTELIHCNDTASVCALSDLTCDSLYSVVVRPCIEIQGCNNTCRPHTRRTAPCTPEILNVTQVNSSIVQVFWTAVNTQANYSVTAMGHTDSLSCSSSGTSCYISNVPCGATYEISAYAISAAGQSLPSYTIPLETRPCCPDTLTVEQVTQAMTNVTWSSAMGARSYVTSLTSPRGHAKCHAMDTHCLMGCITCGTNYSVSLEAISITGHKTQCIYSGFSSSACCPSSVKLYRMVNSTLRVYWRSSRSLYNYTADLYGTRSNYTCNAAQGSNTCDVAEILCGEMYTVVVAPLTQDGSKVMFCPRRLYSVSCSGNTVGMVIYRGRRSVN
ncbi:fibronectin type III domain-containing protein 7-like [Myxocyprinus asiaticus]|uniref:fibronectin type III domain-containing protein 7-like n=1 Tax=Myxocyprinus asiaticus TaxID=70543 RepID=UPI0022218F36|nr:fibronectin type III domain-containing protein 7-like [Myxocyprinus asiaticus]